MSQETVYKITGGPSKFDLMLALFDNTEDHPRSVAFDARTTNQPTSHEVKVFIEMVSRGGNDGESWMFVGISISGDYRIEGFFNTKLRTGSFYLFNTHQTGMSTRSQRVM